MIYIFILTWIVMALKLINVSIIADSWKARFEHENIKNTQTKTNY